MFSGRVLGSGGSEEELDVCTSGSQHSDEEQVSSILFITNLTIGRLGVSVVC